MMRMNINAARRAAGRVALLGLVACGLAASTACKGSSDTTSTTSPTTTATKKTETFSGTVPVKGGVSHTFSITNSGQVDVTLTSTAPASSIVMGVGIGLPSGTGTGCAVLPGASANTAAGSALQFGGLVSAGTLCVVVYDIGNQTAPVTYSVTVNHY